MEIEPVFQGDFVAAFLACDEKFLPYTVTAIASIMENASPETQYDIVVLTDAVPRDKTETAMSWFAKYSNGSLRFYDLGQELAKIGRDNFHVTRRYPITVYFRFFSPSLFQRYRRVLYLDSDIVAFRDIAALFRTDLCGNAVGACHDTMYEEGFRAAWGTPAADYATNVLGLTPDDGYFNTGVLLMDLDRMRESSIMERALDAMKHIDSPSLPDQDILNSVCKGDVLYLDGAWNLQDWVADPLENSTKFHFASQALREECRRTRNACGILHFSEKKPWGFEYAGSLEGCYWHYSAMTPFHDLTMGPWRWPGRAVTGARLLGVTAFHMFRCGFASVFGSAANRQRNRRRLYDYRTRFSGLLGRLLRQRSTGIPSRMK
jgi:Lipopolysaccharide biosynthesis proteins, LPS:glycosyltransferases